MSTHRPQHSLATRRGVRVLAAAACLLLTGCFSQRSFTARPDEIVWLTPEGADPPGCDTRQWLRDAHQQLRRLLPGRGRRALLTEDLLDDTGRPIDVYAHFRLNPKLLHTLWYNATGIAQTAQATGVGNNIDREAPPWPGFDDVWIPIDDHFALAGRLGLARDEAGRPIQSDCVVILPGLFGDNSVWRSRDIARVLLAHSLHVLSLEPRGMGRTEARYPDVPYVFGFFTTGDLMAVAEWLQDRPEIRKTGLVGFCWGANHALLAAWEDGRSDDGPAVPVKLKPALRPLSGRRHYTLGVLAFSPVLDFDPILDRIAGRNISILEDPVLDALQDLIYDRMVRKGYPNPDGDARRLVELEARRSPYYYPGSVQDGWPYVELMPRRLGGYNKLSRARMPVLIVHAANDPLSPAQNVAELFATLRNPRVAAVILPGGGHIGFAPYARRWFYSLILNFFDRELGPAAGCNVRG